MCIVSHASLVGVDKRFRFGNKFYKDLFLKLKIKTFKKLKSLQGSTVMVDSFGRATASRAFTRILGCAYMVRGCQSYRRVPVADSREGLK